MVDTNIVCYLLMESERTVEAQTLFNGNSNWLSETFLFIELTNVLATAVRTKRLANERAFSTLRQATVLFGPERLKSADLFEVLEITGKMNVSAYDARFLAVASHYNLTLITEDKRLRNAAPHLTQSLGEAIANLD